MNLFTISEDVRQLFIHSETLKGRIGSVGVRNGAEQKAIKIAEQFIENIQAEILSLNELLSGLAECRTEDDLNFLLDSSKENYE